MEGANGVEAIIIIVLFVVAAVCLIVIVLVAIAIPIMMAFVDGRFVVLGIRAGFSKNTNALGIPALALVFGMMKFYDS